MEEIQTFPPKPPWISHSSNSGQLCIIHEPPDSAPRSSSPETRRDHSLLFLSSLPQADCIIWTDGSATSGITLGGSRAVITSSDDSSTLLKAPAGLFCCSTTAEMSAILLALKHIMTLSILPQSIRLCTDSRSSLQTLSKGHFHQSSQTGFQIWEQISSLLVAGTNLFLVWVPGHSGLPGNDLAD